MAGKIVVLFTAKKLMWVIKEKGESWDGGYFREKILTERVIPFLNDPENVLVVGEAVFLHDKAPCMRAKATQQLLRASGIEFWVTMFGQEIRLISIRQSILDRLSRKRWKQKWLKNTALVDIRWRLWRKT